ncbi:MAG TPA: membrane protein insertase YidC [Sphingomonas sp.]
MNEQRNMITALVLSALVLLGWALLSDKFFPTANKPATQIVNGKSVPLPQPTPASNAPAQVQDRNKVLAQTPRVKIETPKLAGSIDLRGAQIDDLVLTTQRETIDKNSPPVRLFSPEGTQDAYFASFGWSGQGIALPDANTIWTAAGDVLAPGRPVTLTWNNQQGQAFAIKLSVDDNYLFTVQQSVTNGSGAPVAARPYSLVSRAGPSKDPSSWQVHVGPIGVMGGIAQYKTNWKDLDEAGAAGQKFQSTGGWLGFSDKYWLAAVIPDPKAQVDAAFAGANGQYQAEFAPNVSPVGASRTATQTSYLFAGGKDASLLDTYDSKYGFDKLDHAIDWGWFRVIEKPIFYLLDWLFKQVGNFGVAILLLTVIVRLIMFPIAHKQFKSGQQMKIVQPKMKALQERHKEDKTRLQEEMMKLYKEEKINPLAGCLPVLLQIPIFFSLYKVLTLTLEMRHQPFILWIKDLSAPDPLTPVNLFGYLPFQPTGFLHLSVLAIILGFTMWLQFKLNPQMNMDPAQKQIFALMPWFMMFIMSPFAAGLQVYYILSNLITVGQMQMLNRSAPAAKT